MTTPDIYNEHLISGTRYLAGMSVDHAQCKYEGETRAITEIYKEWYKKYYMLVPTVDMQNLEATVFDAEEDLKRKLCLITINPFPNESFDTTEFKVWCESIIRRSWVDEVLALNYETTDNLERPMHCHMVVRLCKFYSPSHIASMLSRGKGKYFVKKAGVDVQKAPIKDAGNLINYCKKHDPKGETISLKKTSKRGTKRNV